MSALDAMTGPEMLSRISRMAEAPKMRKQQAAINLDMEQRLRAVEGKR